MTMTAKPGGQVLYGDWRRRRGTATDAHLYPPGILEPGQTSGRLPRCGRRIKHADTVRVEVGRPCTDCLVAEIRAAGRPRSGPAHT